MSGSVEKDTPPTEEGASSSKTSSSTATRFPNHLRKLYDVKEMLGEGASAKVWRCVQRETGKVMAIKKFNLNNIDPRQIAREVGVMRYLRHDCVMKCYDVFLEANYVNIVCDLFPGGDLIDGLNLHRQTHGRLKDGQLANLVRQMTIGLEYVHSMSIIHRDIKGENFLSDRPDIGDPGCRIALADFGAAVRVDFEQLSTRIGTPAFWSPEVWVGSYSYGADVWALGCTAYVLVAGQLPFPGGEQDICTPLGEGEEAVRLPYHCSPGCKDYILSCLTKETKERPSASKVAKHPWLQTPVDADAASTWKLPSMQQVGLAAVDLCIDGISAIIVGCFAGIGLCLEMVKSGGESSPSASSSTARTERTPDALVSRKVDVEQEIKLLERQISNISVQNGGQGPEPTGQTSPGKGANFTVAFAAGGWVGSPSKARR
mmetsp:Transcript_34138/g.72594  ORF Transcript_34138/g.72594 Transcript_34138/m.72594 type:complete len:430 (+) Transcript_34138:209-1498(+)